ncbi:MAG: ATPase, T2SS/T4P/T4SS family [bacterium]
MTAIAKFLDYPDLTPFVTDMRLQVGSIPWVNVNRNWMPHPHMTEPVSHMDLDMFVRETQSINDEQDLNIGGRELDFAFSAELAGVVHRFRGHESRNYQGMAIDIRVLRAKGPHAADLGFRPNLFNSFIGNKTGLVIIGGPTGSGKSTTLAALVHEFGLANPGSHVVSLEDPVEYIFNLPNCLVSQKHVPVHVESFERGIFEAKREKPDLIVIGELRNKEAIRAAVEAAGSGHLVLATTFADRVSRVLDALRDAFSVEEHSSLQNRMAYLLRGIICQVLAPCNKVNASGYALPVLVYEALCNDETWVTTALRKGAWSGVDLRSVDIAGRSVSWESRIAELEVKGNIAGPVAQFLRSK